MKLDSRDRTQQEHPESPAFFRRQSRLDRKYGVNIYSINFDEKKLGMITTDI